MKYMLITFVKKPNGQIDEQVSVSTKLRKSDQSMCNIILNFADRKIEKCVVEGRVLDTNWDLINKYYRGVYPTLLDELEKSNPAAQTTEQENGA